LIESFERFRNKLKLNKVDNIYIAKWSIKILWGGSSLFRMHMQAYIEMIQMKDTNPNWNWEYIINLSESDYNIKSLKEIEIFLDQFNSNENFMVYRSHNEYPLDE
jgi:protein xylosyltransferase